MTILPMLLMNGLSLLSVAAATAIIAAPVAAFIARLTANHASNKLLQSHKSELDQELETHKAALGIEADRHRLLLKRQELIFDREVEAAEAYTKLYYKLYPKPRHPDPDWSDAQIDIAEDFGQVESLLEGFLSKHSVALSDSVSTLLDRTKNVAATASFEVGADTGTGTYEPGQTPSQVVADAATEVLENLTKALVDLKRDLLGNPPAQLEKPD